jgi:PAS domain S-box-containing protein
MADPVFPLDAASSRLDALVRASFEGIVFSEHGRIVDANQQFADLSGYEPGELVGMEIAALVAPEDRERVVAAILEKRPSNLEVSLIREDGGRVIVEVHGSPAEYRGRAIRVSAIRDITDRKRVEQRLLKLNSTLVAHSHADHAVLRATDERSYCRDVCKIIVEDCGHTMVWVGLAEHDDGKRVRPMASAGFDEGYLETLQITWADTERGRGPTGTAIRTRRVQTCRNMLIDPSFLPWRTEALRRGYASSIALPLIAGNEAFGALTIYCADPDPFSAEEIARLSELADDFAYGIQVLRLRAAHAGAVEELRASEERLRVADQRKDEFLATLSHELRTPLNAIVGWSQLLLAGVLDAAKQRQAIEVIARNAAAQNQLVNDLLDVSRIVTGKVALSVGEANLADIMTLAIESVRPAADQKLIVLRMEADQGLVISGDASRLQQVFWNLLSNAVKFTPERGDVRVTLSRERTQILVRVADNGMGIAPDFLPRVFDRFSQADASSSRKYQGLGLGLAIVRHLVEAHGGTAGAESAGLGLGASFTLRFPVRAAQRTTHARAAPTPHADERPRRSASELEGLRVLVVDDESDAREMVRAVLEHRGAEVRTAASTREAVDELRHSRFDALISDIAMPEEDGYDLIDRVRAFSTIPAIALTAYGREDDRARALAAGYDRHFAKPVLPDHLVAAVRALTDVSAARRDG